MLRIVLVTDSYKKDILTAKTAKAQRKDITVLGHLSSLNQYHLRPCAAAVKNQLLCAGTRSL
jgi:hypothetical protein